MSSAVFFQTNGLGSQFQFLIQFLMSFSSAATLLCTPRRRSWSVRNPNQRSTRWSAGSPRCQAVMRHSDFPEFTLYEGETGVT